MNSRALVLTLLQLLFFARVAGQVLVMTIAPDWLPEEQHWDSGFLPYAALLPAQIVILVVLTLHTVDAWRLRGRWHVTMENTRQSLKLLAGFYAGAMVMRYILTMTYVPELRWLGHGIPIFFHFVLAAYVYMLAWTPPRRSQHGAVLLNR